MRQEINNDFYTIPLTTFTLQNLNNYLDCEIVITDGVPEANTGFKLAPLKNIAMILPTGYTAYARTIITGKSAEIAILNMNTAQPKGIQGIQGIQGEQGIQGIQGDSAYQVWLDNGHVGTEAEFLDWLKSEYIGHSVDVVADIAARDLIETSVDKKIDVIVIDASADATVDTGWARYLWDVDHWIKTAEGESLDYIPDWSVITNIPAAISGTEESFTTALKENYDNKKFMTNIVLTGNATYSDLMFNTDIYECDCTAGDITIDGLNASAFKKRVKFKKTDDSTNKVILVNIENGGFMEAEFSDNFEITKKNAFAYYDND